MKLSEAAACLGASQPAQNPELTGASIDSRKTRPGDLFICLHGERVDGHDFAGKAIEAGAAAILAQKELPGISAPVLLVENTEKALGDLARFWRQRTKAEVVCVTGTAGKTTLKDALASILGKAGSMTCANGNQNNQIGLPLTILSGNEDDDFWIIEAGISHAGDMEYLGDIARPDLALILNTGIGHAAGLAERGTAWHKTRLLNYLAKDGRALINADYPDLLAETRKLAIPFETFGANSSECDFRLLDFDNGDCAVNLKGEIAKFKTPFKTCFGGETALAATACAITLGVSPEKIQQGFDDAVMPEHRYRKFATDGYLIIDDVYNANPLSMGRALASARAESPDAPLILALGEMGELGDAAKSAHRELGREIAAAKPALLFWHGDYLDEVKAGIAEKLAPESAPHIARTESPRAIADFWRERGFPTGATILFKGSRANRLEDALAAFLKAIKAGEAADVL